MRVKTRLIGFSIIPFFDSLIWFIIFNSKANSYLRLIFSIQMYESWTDLVSLIFTILMSYYHEECVLEEVLEFFFVCSGVSRFFSKFLQHFDYLYLAFISRNQEFSHLLVLFLFEWYVGQFNFSERFFSIGQSIWSVTNFIPFDFVNYQQNLSPEITSIIKKLL